MRRCLENALDFRLNTDMSQESADKETWTHDVANCTYHLLQPCLHALRSKILCMPAQGLRKMGVSGVSTRRPRPERDLHFPKRVL